MLHRGFSAWIVSEDQEMKEELTELNEETNTISCWIPGRPGKVRSSFQVRLDNHLTTRSFSEIPCLVARP